MPFLNWTSNTAEELMAFEDKLFSCLSKKPNRRYVNIDSQDPKKQIWTVTMEPSEVLESNISPLPLVMLHGMGAGVGLWLKNFEPLSRFRQVHALDLPGFGRSFRVRHTNMNTAEEAESFFISSIENWRKVMGLEKFILLGHSLGGFLASAYTLQHPQHVKGLMLVDAWGFPRRQKHFPMPRSIRLGLSVYKTLSPNPLSVLRAAGPLGPSLIAKYRPDIIMKFKHPNLEEKSVIANYVYHCNAQEPSGEIAFRTMVEEVGWAQRPMIERVGEIFPHIPLSMINGKDSWVDYRICHEVQKIRSRSIVQVELIDNAGHHVYADQPEIFNNTVSKLCLTYDKMYNKLKQEQLIKRQNIVNKVNRQIINKKPSEHDSNMEKDKEKEIDDQIENKMGHVIVDYNGDFKNFYDDNFS